MKTFQLFTIAVIVAFLSGCDSKSPEGDATSGVSHGAVIGLSMDTLQEERWQRDRDLFVARAEELGATVEVRSANSDDQQQVSDVQSLITKGCDVIVIIPHDGEVMARGVELAHQANIPVVAYDRLIRNCDLDLYVTFDNVKVGMAQSQYLIDHLQPTPEKPVRLVRIYGAPTDNNAQLFKAGQDRVLQPYIDSGAVVVLHEDWADDWRPDNAKRIMSAAITNHGHDFDAVLVSNDGTAGGAIQSLTEEGLAGKIPVTGQDADLVACQRIAAGTQVMTVYKPLPTLARGAAEIAVRVARGEPSGADQTLANGYKDVQSIYFPIVMVDRDNLVTTVIADGFHTYDDVYRSIPEDQRPPRP